jgi:16S rRNA processing protein RimM
VLLEIGHVVRPHGVRGEVVVELTTNVEGRFAPGQVLDLDGRALTIQASTPLPARGGPHGRRMIIQFSGLTRKEEADGLRGGVLRAEPMADQSALWVHELVGATVFDLEGAALGVVEAVQANPASDLLVLDGGALVPLRFVATSEPGKVVIDAPPGLFDL